MSKAKKLRVKEVAAVAQSITNAQETLPTEVISALKSSRHLDLFIDRKQLVQLLEQKSTIHDASISSDYTTLYKSLKGRQYAEFQLKWLEHVNMDSPWLQWMLKSMIAMIFVFPTPNILKVWILKLTTSCSTG